MRSGVGAAALSADRNSIDLEEAAIDLSRFDEEVAQTKTHDHPYEDVCGLCIPHLVAATDLYRGDFLEGFTVRDAPEFEDWVRNVSEVYRLRASDAFNRLGTAQAADGDYPGAIASVRRWIHLDQLHEPAHRRLMLLHAWAGDRPGSIDAYRDFVAVLDRELGVPPLEETSELFEAILDEDLPPAPGLRRTIKTGVAAPKAADTGLINRHQELDQLRSALDLSKTKGQILSLSGAPWMGKTRLIEELLSEAGPKGHRVLVGRSFRMEKQLPFGVVSQILNSVAKDIIERRAEFPEWAIVEISNLIPGLSTGHHEVSQDRFGELRLFEAVDAVVSKLSESTPIVLVVDDLQWTDSPSVSLVSYLSKRISRSRVLVLTARRVGEQLLPEAKELAELGEPIELGPLTPNDLSDLVDSEKAESLINQTGGVPLLIAEALTRETGESLRTIERYMESRLRDVSELGRQVLSTAAILTGACTTSLLRRTSGRSEEEVVDAIEELTRIGLIRELPGGEVLGFTLDALETTAYESVSLARRRLLHRRAGEALSDSPRSRVDVRTAAAVATQFRGAGDERSSEWYAVAGDLAREVYANAEARDFYETALALGADDPGRLRLALGELEIAAGGYSNALKELNTAVALSGGETRALVEHRLGDVMRLLGQLDRADEHYARSVKEHPKPAELYSDWALLLHRRDLHEEATRMAERALGAVAELDDPSAASRAHNIQGLVSTNPSKAMEEVDRALELSGENDLAAMAALNNKAHLLNGVGERDEAIRLVTEALHLAIKTGHRHREAALHNHLADLLYQAGRIEESQGSQLKAMTRFAEIGSDDWEPEVWLLSRW